MERQQGGGVKWEGRGDWGGGVSDGEAVKEGGGKWEGRGGLGGG